MLQLVLKDKEGYDGKCNDKCIMEEHLGNLISHQSCYSVGGSSPPTRVDLLKRLGDIIWGVYMTRGPPTKQPRIKIFGANMLLCSNVNVTRNGNNNQQTCLPLQSPTPTSARTEASPGRFGQAYRSGCTGRCHGIIRDLPAS